MKKRFNVNKKYEWFAVRKSNNKIVNGWEPSDGEKPETYYLKYDLNDIFPDNKFSEFKIISGLKLFQSGINPYDWNSWEGTTNY